MRYIMCNMQHITICCKYSKYNNVFPKNLGKKSLCEIFFKGKFIKKYVKSCLKLANNVDY